MTTIDEQNSRQIRQPMDVLITMSLADTDISMTYSGYSSAKVADGVLDERGWPMRKLADLQGDGFPLDGSCVLYDSTTQPSQANGKLGVRSNVGESVSVTATGSKVMASLTVLVTGAESVTYNGTTTNIANNQVTIPVLSTSITMTFAPASQTERIEISDIFPDQEFRITNDNLISATVSLRSDLSLFDQTLPESELNIEVYHGADVTENVASIPEDTPVTYIAGYEGDMSPERKFYVSGQVTWADNVLSIHAVDAVHFLDDVNIVAPVTEDDSDYFAGASRHVLKRAGIDVDEDYYYDSWWSTAYRWIIPENTNGRALIAFYNQCLNITDDKSNLIDGTGKLYSPLRFIYVDAGIPQLRTKYLSYDLKVRKIYEDDCADIKKDVEVSVGTVTANWKAIISGDYDTFYESKIAKVGSATLIKNVGTSLSFDEYTRVWTIGLFCGRNWDNDIAKKILNKYGAIAGWGYMCPITPADSAGDSFSSSGAVEILNPVVGDKILIGEIPQDEFRTYPSSQDTGVTTFSSFVPWSQSYKSWKPAGSSGPTIKTATQMWNFLKNTEIIDSSAESIDLDIYGFAYYTNPTTKSYTVRDSAMVYDYGDAPIIGRVAAKKSDSSNVEIYPSKMLAAPLHRSPITGSFTWKGDPRMQPRDVVEWERLDGTTETITLENITITHEGGGTSAEITYRKGVV